MWSERTLALIRAAEQEDLGEIGDVSAALLDDGERSVAAQVVPRAAGVICGLSLGPEICRVFSKRLAVELRFEPAMHAEGGRPCADGDAAAPDVAVAYLRGPRAAVLSTERTLLNFLCRMSGVATLTRCYVEAGRRVNPQVRILDTRKTLPGWRELDKYAVRCGGGLNHRQGLYDAVLIKDNHLHGIPTDRLAAALFDLLNRLERRPAFVEVEVDNLAQFDQVCRVVGVDIVLLDNFAPQDMREAVRRRDALGLRGKLALEASGGVSLDRVGEIAASGVDRISIGALTHSAPAFDIGLDMS